MRPCVCVCECVRWGRRELSVDGGGRGWGGGGDFSKYKDVLKYRRFHS